MMRQKIEDKINETRKELRGKEDYQMANGEWTDRYETLDYIRQDNLISGKYTISESDEMKGIRLTIVDKDSGAIIREMK